MELQQIDVKTAFLNGELEEEVQMKQLEGFSSSDGDHLVCKLKKSIYGLKQAFCQWYLKFHDVISSFGFEENVMDQCILVCRQGALVYKPYLNKLTSNVVSKGRSHRHLCKHTN